MTQRTCLHVFQVSHLAINILPTNQIYSETSRSDFLNIKVWFIDQHPMLLEITCRINLTLVIDNRII